MTKQDLSQIIFRIEKVERAVFGTGNGKKAKKKKETISNGDLDFSLNERAFVKRYASGKSGPKKFTILLAYLSDGQIGTNIQLSDIKKRWNKMKSLLGKFNMFYSNEAKNKGWVDSKEYGKYSLTKEWKESLSE